MGLFDFFKKKPTSETPIQDKTESTNTSQPQKISENKLEAILRLASTEAGYRPEFYRLLLSENLVVLTDGNSVGGGERVLEEDTEVNLVTFKSGEIPVFTSTDRIFDKGGVKEKVPFLEVNGRSLLDMTRGAKLLLNPYSDYAKELLPNEIESMLNGTILGESREKITVKQDTKVLLAQPKDYPTDMVNALKIIFSNHSTVKNAYLALMSDGTNPKPNLIFAIEADGDFQTIVDEAGFTAQQFLLPDDVVNFVKIGKSGLDDYFINETTPFYSRN
jgi:hypothetical protein